MRQGSDYGFTQKVRPSLAGASSYQAMPSKINIVNATTKSVVRDRNQRRQNNRKSSNFRNQKKKTSAGSLGRPSPKSRETSQPGPAKRDQSS